MRGREGVGRVGLLHREGGMRYSTREGERDSVREGREGRKEVGRVRRREGVR